MVWHENGWCTRFRYSQSCQTYLGMLCIVSAPGCLKVMSIQDKLFTFLIGWNYFLFFSLILINSDWHIWLFGNKRPSGQDPIHVWQNKGWHQEVTSVQNTMPDHHTHTYIHAHTRRALENMPGLSSGNNNITLPLPSCSKSLGSSTGNLQGSGKNGFIEILHIQRFSGTYTLILTS